MDNTPKQGTSPLLVLFMLTGFVGLIMAVVVFLSEGNTSSTPDGSNVAAVATPNSALNRPAENFQLMDINGELVSLAQFRGRPVFINLWWTGCPPCVREFPAFQQFMEEQGDDGAVVLAINQGESVGEIRPFLSDLGITDVPVLLDTDMTIGQLYPYNGFFPTTYLIDAEGNVRFRRIGEIGLGEMYEFLESAETS